MRVLKVVLPASLLVSMTSVAFANPHIGGFNSSGTSYNFTSQYVDITTPNYPTVGSQSASSAYDMLEDATGNNFVQVGWYSANQQGLVPDGIRYFSEWNSRVAWSTVGPAAGTTHGYRNVIQNGQYTGTADGATIGSWPINSTYTAYEFSEELNGNLPYNAQFIGQSSYHATFANLRVYSNGTTYYSPALTQKTDPDGATDWTNYSVGVASSTLGFWDTRY